MCLQLGYPGKDTHFPEKVQELRPDAMVTFWKIYLRKDGELRSPLYSPKASHGTVSRNGWHVSNRKSVNISGWEWGSHVIQKGIHVYTSRDAGRREIQESHWDAPPVLVRVQARRKDIVAYDRYGTEAVCTRVYVPSADRTKVCHGRVR